MANKIRLMGVGNTVSNETISLVAYTIPINKIINCDIKIIGFDLLNSKGVSFNRILAARNTLGIVSLISGAGTNVVAPIKDAGYSSTGISESVSLNNLLFKIDGQLAIPMVWNYIIDINTF